MVPKNKDGNYKYMIWKEPYGSKTLLHLVRRNNHTFRDVNKIRKDADKCWFYREGLPIAMTPNEDIKELVQQSFPGKDYEMSGCAILIRNEHLSSLHNMITKYFDEYQE